MQGQALGQQVLVTSTVCDPGLEYACGDIGASGLGIVFYASASAFECGETQQSSCNYLEVAPNGWNGELVNCQGGSCGGNTKTSDWGSGSVGTGKGYPFCGVGTTGFTSFIPGASGTAIGTGYSNTTAIMPVSMCGNQNAAMLARGYPGGGQTDWSLASMDELSALYGYTGRNAIGGFAPALYWSSTQSPSQKSEAWFINFNGATENYITSDDAGGVRPVRDF